MPQQQPSPDVAPIAPSQPAPAAPPAQPAQPASPDLPPPAGQPAPTLAPSLLDGPATAAQMHQAALAQREVLGNQLEQLENRRRELSQQLQDPMVGGADRAGIERRIADVDVRIADLEKQIAQSEANVAQTAGVPGAIEPEPVYQQSGGDEEEGFFAALGVTTPLWLIAIWLLRRRWRRGAGAPRATADLGTQLTRVEQSVESIALEVERIGEAQRFTARVLAESDAVRALGAGAAEPVAVRQREAAPERSR